MKPTAAILIVAGLRFRIDGDRLRHSPSARKDYKIFVGEAAVTIDAMMR
jgi:hypothetical protein